MRSVDPNFESVNKQNATGSSGKATGIGFDTGYKPVPSDKAQQNGSRGTNR